MEQDHVGTHGENDHLQAKERDLGMKPALLTP